MLNKNVVCLKQLHVTIFALLLQAIPKQVNFLCHQHSAHAAA